MDVATITMPIEEARAKLAEYEAGLAGRPPTDEDRGVILGMKAIAKGKSLIDLREVFRSCPFDALHRPCLAVARAHWKWVFMRRWSGGSVRFAKDTSHTNGSRRTAWHTYFELPDNTLPVGTRADAYTGDLKALVPLIPPNLRPVKALHRYCILFEAEWEPVAPTDPMLIRHLHGGLYVVLSTWDLTAVEKAVLSGRFGGQS